MKLDIAMKLIILLSLLCFALSLMDDPGDPASLEDKMQDMKVKLQDSKLSASNATTDQPPKAATLDDLAKDLQEFKKRIEKSISIVSLKYWWLLRSLRDIKPGKDGAPGKDGEAGKDGAPGKDGAAGKDGRDGRDGAPGPQGAKGDPGKKGVPGNDGVRGRDGAQGPQGPKGNKGPAGPVGPPGLMGPNGTNEETGKPEGGVTYVHWGRTTCPGDGEIVYPGRIGGTYYSHKGGASEYVCLPNTPKYANHKDGVQGEGYMYGTEYEVSSFNPFKKNLHNHDAPCAVCYVKSRGSQITVPARNDCSASWTREYHGYLMTAHHSHAHSSTYICVDEDAEYVPGTHTSLNGALLYPVEGRCGSLPCKPYVDGWELTCAVCTK